MLLRNKTDIKVGDRVRITYGLADATGVVIDYSGPIGLEGRHTYRIRFTIGPEFTAETEMPAGTFEVVHDETKGSRRTRPHPEYSGTAMTEEAMRVHLLNLLGVAPW